MTDKVRYAILFFLVGTTLVCLLFALCSRHLALATAQIRAAILPAERVEIDVHWVARPDRTLPVVVLRDPNDIHELTESVEVVGLYWRHVEVGVGETYRLRAVHGSKQSDVV
jgi:hypothetical protein